MFATKMAQVIDVMSRRSRNYQRPYRIDYTQAKGECFKQFVKFINLFAASHEHSWLMYQKLHP